MGILPFLPALGWLKSGEAEESFPSDGWLAEKRSVQWGAEQRGVQWAAEKRGVIWKASNES